MLIIFIKKIYLDWLLRLTIILVLKVNIIDINLYNIILKYYIFNHISEHCKYIYQ